MSCNLHLYFPDSVQIENVGIALGIMYGRQVLRGTVQNNTEYARLPRGVDFRVDPHEPSMVAIVIEDARGDKHSAYYHFESVEGGRMLSMISTALNIALARRLTDLFGGRLVYKDVDDWSPNKPDYKRPEYKHNNAQDDPGFTDLHQRLLAITPITSEEIKSCYPLAGYSDMVEGFEQFARLV